MTVQAIPQNYPRISPIFALKDSAKAIAFYRDIFGAKERLRLANPTARWRIVRWSSATR